MAKKLKDEIYVAVQDFGGQEPQMLVWSASGSARAVRIEVGEAYAYPGEDKKVGWMRAKKENAIRVVRASITAHLR